MALAFVMFSCSDDSSSSTQVNTSLVGKWNGITYKKEDTGNISAMPNCDNFSGTYYLRQLDFVLFTATNAIQVEAYDTCTEDNLPVVIGDYDPENEGNIPVIFNPELTVNVHLIDSNTLKLTVPGDGEYTYSRQQ